MSAGKCRPQTVPSYTPGYYPNFPGEGLTASLDAPAVTLHYPRHCLERLTLASFEPVFVKPAGDVLLAKALAVKGPDVAGHLFIVGNG